MTLILQRRLLEESNGEDLKKQPSLVPTAEESKEIKSEIPQQSEVGGSNNGKEDPPSSELKNGRRWKRRETTRKNWKRTNPRRWMLV